MWELPNLQLARQTAGHLGTPFVAGVRWEQSRRTKPLTCEVYTKLQELVSELS